MRAIGAPRAACLAIGLVLVGLLALSPASALAYGASPGTATSATGQITGRATDASTGAPIQNLEVDLYSDAVYSGEVISAATCTAADGTYAFSGLEAGTYHVSFEGDEVYCPRTNYLWQFYDDAQSWASAEPIYLIPGSMVKSGVDAAMPPAGQITGTVTDASTHAPLRNIEVDVYDSSGGWTSTCTAADGTYRVVGLATGAYTMAFRGDGPSCPKTNYLDQIYNDEPSWASADPVSVTEGSTTSGIDAALNAGGQITGTVTDASTHTPISDVEVDAYDSYGDQVGSTCTAANGTYTIIGLETRTYHVGFSAGCGANYLSQFYDDEQSLASADSVKVTAGATTSGVNAAMDPGGEITGTVTAPPGVSVEVDAYNSSGTWSGSTCANGTYTFVGLPTGNYTVSTSDNFHGPCGPQLCYETSSQAVSVTAGALPTSGIDFTASVCPIEVKGAVTDSTTKAPVQGATVTVYDTNGNSLGSTTTDSTGAYEVTIPLGIYTVEVGFAAPGYVSQFYDDEPSLQQALPVPIFLTTDAGGAFDIDAALVKSQPPPAAATPSPVTATPPSSVSAATATKPSLAHLKETHSVFRTGSKLATFARTQTPVGTTFSFVLNTASTVKLSFMRLVKGRNVDGTCVLRTTGDHGPSCGRLVLVASLTYSASPGSHQLQFDGRASPSRKLSPGHYELLLLATNPAGRSPPRSISFTIIK